MATHVQSGQVTGADDDSTVAITDVLDLTRAFLIVEVSGPLLSSGPEYFAFEGSFNSTTELRFQKYNATPTGDYAWTVVWCDDEEFLVEATSSLIGTGSATTPVALSRAFDEARSFMVGSGRVNANVGATNNHVAWATYEFSTSSELTVTRGATSATARLFFTVFAVEWQASDGVVVTSAVTSLSGNMASPGVTVNHGATGVVLASSLLFSSTRHATSGLEQNAIKRDLPNTTQVRFSRDVTTNSYQSYCSWFLVQFPADLGVVTQHVADAAAAGDTTEPTPIAAVTLADSLCLVTNSCGGTGTAHPRGYWRSALTSTTQVTSTRGYTGQSGALAVQVMDLSGYTPRIELTPDPLVLQLAVPAPTVDAPRVLAPDPLVLQLALPAPAIDAPRVLAPDPLVMSLAVPSVAIGGVGLTLTPDPLVLSLAVPEVALVFNLRVYRSSRPPLLGERIRALEDANAAPPNPN